jgi:signal transduction histidine kinase/ActR/RegA family two-component response regulator
VLLAIVAIGAIPPLVFSGILLKRYADSERNRAAVQLQESARAIARTIDSEFSAVASVLAALSSLPSLDDGDLRLFEYRLRSVAAKTGRHFELADTTGKIRVSTAQAPERAATGSVAAEIAPAIEMRRPYMSTVHRADDGRLFTRIILPVLSGGKINWTLHAIVEPADFARILAHPGVPQEWIVAIADQNGTQFARSHRAELYAGQPLVPELERAVKAQRSVTMHTVSLEGAALLSTVATAPLSGWSVAVGLPEATLQQPLREQLNYLVLLGAALITLAFLCGYLVARYLVGSMRKLGTLAHAVGAGELVEPPETAVQEVAQLGGALSEVSRTLRDRTLELARLNATLEQQVSMRTAELSDANTKLVTEMTRREESEAQLRHMQRLEAIGQLTGGIAHDFNNMLAVIISSLNLVQRRLGRGNHDVAEFVDSAMQGAERAANLTRRLLAFSRQQALSPEPIEANRLLVGMEDILRRSLPENISIETVMSGGLWRTYADVHALENVLVNLAVNARDAMPKGGKLTIETGNTDLDASHSVANDEVVPGQYVLISVSDTGKGMTPAVLDRAFDPFFTTKPTGQGTGLGLSQVHGFIKQSKGHVSIRSAPGAGTTVKLYLPRYVGRTEAAAETHPAVPVRSAAGARDTIMVVEDDAEVRHMAVQMLAELNYDTVEADSGQSALKLLAKSNDVKLVFTDVVMPDMNGRALADEIAKRWPGLKVVFTTGYTRDAIVHNGILDPGVQLISKPFKLDELAAKINATLVGGPIKSTGESGRSRDSG